MTDPSSFRRCAGRLVGKVRRTCRRWALVEPGSRVALGISGGGDSLAMLLLMTAVSRTLKRPLDLVGLHVALDAQGRTAGLATELRELCLEQGVEVADIRPRLEDGEGFPADCFQCAHIRRRTLIEEAGERGCRILAIGHHADDVVETWLLSLFYTGTPEAIPPLRQYFDGAVTLIRPLYELRKAELERLLRLGGFQQTARVCPQQAHSKRERVRLALAALGRDQRLVRRQLYWSAIRGLCPTEGRATGPRLW